MINTDKWEPYFDLNISIDLFVKLKMLFTNALPEQILSFNLSKSSETSSADDSRQSLV